MINKTRIQKIHADLSAVLKEFAEQNGLNVSPFNITYNSSGFKFSCNMGDKSEIGDADPVLSDNLTRFGNWYDLNPTDLNKTFVLNGQSVVLEGMKNKTTVIFRTDNGKRYRIDGNRFALAVGRKPIDLNRGVNI